MSDNKTTDLPAIRNTESLLERAAELDPEAWVSPMPARMQAFSAMRSKRPRT